MMLEQQSRILTSDGWQLGVRVWERQNQDPASILVIVFPALAAPAHAYVRMAHFLADKGGYRVILADPRGIGNSRPLPSRQVDYGITAHLDCDWPAIVGWARRRYPFGPVVLLGHSLGGQLCALYAGKYSGQVQAVVLLNACFVHYRNWPLPYAPMLWGIFVCYWAVARLLGYLPGTRLGLKHPASKLVIQDWARWGLSGIYTSTNGENLEPYLARVAQPVLSISFSDDRFYGPKKAVDDFTRRLQRSRLTRWHLSPGELGTSRLGHFYHLKTGQRLWEQIHGWIKDQVLQCSTR
jgi:predicted alpha/beta hydrolase